MFRTYRAAFLLLLSACLAACDSSEPGKISLDDYEGPEGEAMVRHMIKTLPPVHPEIPKVYTVVKGPHLKSTSMDFIHRMDDLKLTFISGEVLTQRDDPDRTIIDPRSGLAPVQIQIAEMKRAGGDSFHVVAAWAYKKDYERHQYKLTKTASGYDVEHVQRLEGNYVNDPELKKP